MSEVDTRDHPNLGRVWGGILLACHHGLTDPLIDFMHETFEKFARQY